MKHHIVHYFRTCTPFKEKSFYHFEDSHKLKLMTNFDVNLISLPRSGTNSTFHTLFITPRNEVRLTSKFVTSEFVRSFIYKVPKIIRRLLLK